MQYRLAPGAMRTAGCHGNRRDLWGWVLSVPGAEPGVGHFTESKTHAKARGSIMSLEKEYGDRLGKRRLAPAPVRSPLHKRIPAQKAIAANDQRRCRGRGHTAM